MAGKLEGKTAIITGAGRGIGKEVALLFAREGCRVLVNDLGTSVAGEGADRTPAEQTVAEITATGGEAMAHYGDVADMDAAEDMVRTALNAWGRLDILVNTAGILRDRMVFNMTEEEWDAVVRVHMKGTFATTKFASIYWRQSRQGGRLINFTSGSGLFGAPGQPNYAAAKMGIWGFTLSCARALGRYGVTANSIAPGAATRMTDTVPESRAAARTARIMAEAAKGTERDPANIAPPLVYLASDQGGWISGRCFGISGYRITLYSNIAPQVVLQGSKMWTTDELFGRMEPTFRQFIQPVA
ncbi:SDR family NAD(P)-dependent oxidoreductase [Tepidiforma sp.]|uniref:SDR family NAD(P)-dependent oxidoreductase n=1 Tax=Tepidiforma sp. TaxID=2682230 RepID=UPI002ADD3875|nr:SDR family NAD(P)-dependent oxidoreductase [Tepidiforma sp.]